MFWLAVFVSACGWSCRCTWFPFIYDCVASFWQFYHCGVCQIQVSECDTVSLMWRGHKTELARKTAQCQHTQPQTDVSWSMRWGCNLVGLTGPGWAENDQSGILDSDNWGKWTRSTNTSQHEQHNSDLSTYSQMFVCVWASVCDCEWMRERKERKV